MRRYWKHSLMVLIALAIFVPAASARPFGRGGFHGGGFYGGGFYAPPVYGWYGPGFGWYGPGYGWYGSSWAPYRSEAARTDTGKVKIDTKRKDAMVYVDGGYAGTVGDLKTFKLRAGTHDIELRGPDGHSFYQERVDVVPGKTTKLVP